VTRASFDPSARPHPRLHGPAPARRLHETIPYAKVRNESDRGDDMSTATVTSKGQITIPAAVRVALDLEAGDRVEFVEVEPGRYELIAATRSVSALKGMFGKARKRVSVDEMNEAIAAHGAKAR